DVSAQVVQDLGIAGHPVRLDSQAKYAVVALGEAEIYLRLPTRADYREKIWDHAGGVLIVLEAGGRVSDVSGKPLEWTHGAELAANRGVAVSHGPWHDKIITKLTELGVK
ncbi:MAG: 3'(2'),5'-bisphosphate nucleotidase, partial [Planctomycetaceae bacterium]|nr:3'(2'),5'-bisphosphate nucleotidase [Planctomycetaceae bacterium]